MRSDLKRNDTRVSNPNVRGTVNLEVSIDDTVLLLWQHRSGTAWVPDAESALLDVGGQLIVSRVGGRADLAGDN